MSTGDILVFNKESFERANEKLSKENSELRNLLQINLEVAPPVFFCTVEPSSEAEEKKLIYALDCLLVLCSNLEKYELCRDIHNQLKIIKLKKARGKTPKAKVTIT